MQDSHGKPGPHQHCCNNRSNNDLAAPNLALSGLKRIVSKFALSSCNTHKFQKSVKVTKAYKKILLA